MNIENNKISGKQLGRLVFHDFFALQTLVLPGMLAKTAGIDGFFALAAGSAAGLGLLFLVLGQIRDMQQNGQDYHACLRACFGGLLTVVILMVYLLSALFGAAYGLRLLCDITRQYLIRDIPAWLVMAVLVLLAVYGLYAGLESRGRMYEIVFWLVLVPLFVMFFLSARNVEADRWVPVFCAEGWQFLEGSYLVFVFFSGMVGLPMLAEGVLPRTDTAHVLKQSVCLCVCINLVLYLLLTGIFGAPTVAAMETAPLTLTALVKVPGGFFERHDALLCGIWLVSVFAFVENTLFYMIWCIKKIGKIRVQGRALPVAGIAVYVLALFMYRSRDITLQLARVYAGIAVPVLVGITVVACILPAWKNRKQKRSTGSKEENR